MKLGTFTLVFFAMSGPAFAGMDTSSWHEVKGPRPVPVLMRLDGSESQWRAYLMGAHLAVLGSTVPRGRSYRWIHDGYSGQGFVELQVDEHGVGILTSSETNKAKFLRASETVKFEKALEETPFATMREDDKSSGLDDCQDNVLEAVVNGRYHFVRRGCGLPPELVEPVNLLSHLATDNTPASAAPDFVWVMPPKGEKQ